MKLAVRTVGPDDAPPVVFLGSLGSTIDMWDPQVGALGGELYCCCGAIAAMNLRPQLAGIDVPCVVVVGVDDPNTPSEHADVIAAAIPAAKRELIDGAHFCNWDNATAVNDIISRHARG